MYELFYTQTKCTGSKMYENVKQSVQKVMGIIKDVRCVCSIEAQPSFYKISSNPF